MPAYRQPLALGNFSWDVCHYCATSSLCRRLKFWVRGVGVRRDGDYNREDAAISSRIREPKVLFSGRSETVGEEGLHGVGELLFPFVTDIKFVICQRCLLRSPSFYPSPGFAASAQFCPFHPLVLSGVFLFPFLALSVASNFASVLRRSSFQHVRREGVFQGDTDFGSKASLQSFQRAGRGSFHGGAEIRG